MISYCTKKDKIKAIRQLVQTLCIFYFEDVTSRELDVLCEIVHAGEVGYDSKTSFMLNYKSSKESYFQVLDRLYRKGVLRKKEFRTGKELHPYFKDIRKLVEGNLSPHKFEVKVGETTLLTLDDRFIIIQYDGVN